MPRVSRGASETGSRWSLSYIYPCLEHRVPCCVWTIRFCYEQRHLNMWQWKKHSVCSHNHTTRTHFSPWMMNDMSTAHSVTINLLPHLWQTLLLIVYGSGQSVHWFLCRLWHTHTHTEPWDNCYILPQRQMTADRTGFRQQCVSEVGLCSEPRFGSNCCQLFVLWLWNHQLYINMDTEQTGIIFKLLPPVNTAAHGDWNCKHNLGAKKYAALFSKPWQLKKNSLEVLFCFLENGVSFPPS